MGAFLKPYGFLASTGKPGKRSGRYAAGRKAVERESVCGLHNVAYGVEL